MDADLKDMLKISNSVGEDPRLVQGGGGNTSVKTDGGDKMYVKASGTGLGDMVEGKGYRLVDVEKCRAMVDDEQLRAMEPAARESAVLSKLMDCCLDDLEGRPSVETSLHAMLGRCVVHTHPSVVNGLLCAEGGKEKLQELLADLDPPLLYIEYCGAGFVLAVTMQEALEEYAAEHGREPEAVFLENHGLFVHCDDADRALQITHDIFNAIEDAAEKAIDAADLPEFEPHDEVQQRELVGEVSASARRFYSKVFGAPALVTFADDATVRRFLTSPNARAMASVKPMTPDQVVYCKDSPVWVDLPEDAEGVQEAVTAALEAARNGEYTPVCVLVDGLGLFCAAPTPKLLNAVAACMVATLETLLIADQFGGARGLTEDSIEFIRNWEIEGFRQRVARGKGSQDELAGKVALVTGAGSGLGRGISLVLASKGAHVILADIDENGARETEERIADQDSTGVGCPVWVDVTSEDAVAEMVDKAVRHLGGVDILVNCAGIAPVYPLWEFPLGAWRKTLEVNLTGYMLVAREVARRFIAQKTGGSIVNISSKSGLQASKNHSAYNATKAGEIHLARGWALELAEFGVRVNVVCPGNVFHESKIWNEDYIEALAEKRGLKPEEVIPYYINLTALKQDVKWKDIGEAVAFLSSTRSAKVTGQVLVVDAGQVFVR